MNIHIYFYLYTYTKIYLYIYIYIYKYEHLYIQGKSTLCSAYTIALLSSLLDKYSGER